MGFDSKLRLQSLGNLKKNRKRTIKIKKISSILNSKYEAYFKKKTLRYFNPHLDVCFVIHTCFQFHFVNYTFLCLSTHDHGFHFQQMAETPELANFVVTDQQTARKTLNKKCVQIQTVQMI